MVRQVQYNGRRARFTFGSQFRVCFSAVKSWWCLCWNVSSRGTREEDKLSLLEQVTHSEAHTHIHTTYMELRMGRLLAVDPSVCTATVPQPWALSYLFIHSS
jgi:hypothetical protein